MARIFEKLFGKSASRLEGGLGEEMETREDARAAFEKRLRELI